MFLNYIYPFIPDLSNFEPYFIWSWSSSYPSIIWNNRAADYFAYPISGINIELFPANWAPNIIANMAVNISYTVTLGWLSRIMTAPK